MKTIAIVIMALIPWQSVFADDLFCRVEVNYLDRQGELGNLILIEGLEEDEGGGHFNKAKRQYGKNKILVTKVRYAKESLTISFKGAGTSLKLKTALKENQFFEVFRTMRDEVESGYENEFLGLTDDGDEEDPSEQLMVIVQLRIMCNWR